MSIAADGKNHIFYQLMTLGVRCKGAMGPSIGRDSENVHYSLTTQGYQWHWWAVMYGNGGMKTHWVSICLSFNLSHTAHGEGGETVLKMNREIYFSFLHFITRACAIRESVIWVISLLVSPAAAQLERGRSKYMCINWTTALWGPVVWVIDLFWGFFWFCFVFPGRENR